MSILRQGLTRARNRAGLDGGTMFAAECMMAVIPVVFAALVLFHRRAISGLPVVTWMGLAALAAVATGIVVHRRTSVLPPAAGTIEPWWLVAGGLTVLVVTTGGLSVHGPSDWWLGLAAIPGYPLIAIGLLGLIRGRAPGRDADLLVDAGVAAAACGLGLWMVAVRPSAMHGHHGLALVVAHVLLPALDVALLTLVARLLQLPGEQLATYRRLALALVYLLAAHIVSIMPMVAGWRATATATVETMLVICSFGLWGLAALDRSMRNLFDPLTSDPPAFSPGHMIAVCGAMLVVPALVVIEAQRRAFVSATVAVGAGLLSPVLAGYMANLLWQRARTERRAQHDDLTDLPNRNLFLDRLARAIAHARRNEAPIGVLFIDLDRFKQVNDTFGHPTGDRLLVGVSERMQSVLRDEDTVARLGGDEFAVLLAHVSDFDGVVTVAQKLMAAFNSPFDVNAEPLAMTASVGVAVYPQDGADANELMASADAAMYRAKEQGGRTYEIFSVSLRSRVQDRLALESALCQALERDELVLHYQPKVDLRSGRIVGSEALVRWQHPKLGLLMPGHFIPTAEQSGLIVALGEHVLRSACEQNRAWQLSGLPPLVVSVNVSARQFRQGIADTTAAVLRETGLEARWLELELTESAAVESLRLTDRALDELLAMGVVCALDDFGTGYCSLKYLSELPIATLKIDKSFVQEASERGTSIVSAIISLGHSLGLGIVAEGVETQEQLDYLVDQGCDQVQGYLFSKPLPAPAFSRLLLDSVVQGPGLLPLIRTPLVTPAQPRPEQVGASI